MLRRALVRSGVCRAALQRRWATQGQLDRRVQIAGRASRLAKQKLSAAVAAQKKQLVQAKQQQARQKALLAKQRSARRAQAAKAKAQATAARKKAAQAKGAAAAARKALRTARAAVASARKGVISSKGAGDRRVAVATLNNAKKREAAAAKLLKKAIVARPKKLKLVVAKKKTLGGKKATKSDAALRLRQRTAAARKAAKAAAAALVQAKKAQMDGLKLVKARAKVNTKASRRSARRQLRKQAGPSSPYPLFMRDALKGSKPGSGAVQAAAAKWKSMSDAEKQPYVREAAQNRAKYSELKAEAKSPKPMNKRNAFFKQHFAAAYDEAKRSGADRKEAFTLAVRTVSAKWMRQP